MRNWNHIRSVSLCTGGSGGTYFGALVANVLDRGAGSGLRTGLKARSIGRSHLKLMQKFGDGRGFAVLG
jgi:hypothetical protein